MRKILGLLLVGLLLAPAPAWASATGTLAGRIFSREGSPKVTGVLLAGPALGTEVASVPVLGDGTFEADRVPAGPVSVALQTDDGIYAIATPISIAPGTTRTVSLALKGRQGTPTPSPAPAPAPEEKKEKKKSGGFWSNPLYASLVIIGGAIVVGVLIDQATKNNNNAPASPSGAND
jgi:hypothetical protein